MTTSSTFRILPEYICVYPQEYRFHRKWGYSYYFMPGCDNKNESGKIKKNFISFRESQFFENGKKGL